MNIDLTDCETSAQAVTKICYNEGTRNLDYRIECKDLEDIKKCVEIINQYNAFDAKKVNRALEDHTNTLIQSPYNDEIKNPAFEYIIGREGSPVMYLRERFDQIKDLEDRMKLIKYESEADEMTIEVSPFGGAEVRLWWD